MRETNNEMKNILGCAATFLGLVLLQNCIGTKDWIEIELGLQEIEQTIEIKWNWGTHFRNSPAIFSHDSIRDFCTWDF